MATNLDALKDVVVLTLKAALTPVLERLVVVETNAARLDKAIDAIPGLRDRLLLLETKADLPTDRDRLLADVLARVTLLEQAEPPPVVELAPVETRLAALEGKTAAPVIDTLTAQDVAALRTKVEALAVAPPVVDVFAIERRVTALEARATPEHELIDMITGTLARTDTVVSEVRERVATLVRDSETPPPPDPAVGELRERVAALDARTSELRDRLVATEQRAAVPGPPGPPGRDGMDGKDGTPGVHGTDGRDGVPGRDGSDGKDGRDGADGLGFDDLDVEFDGDRTLVLKMARGDRQKRWPLVLPYMRQQGVYRDGARYTKGDVVTWAGSQWHCNEDTTTKPGDASSAWTLVVKRGRDGRDGKDAPAAPVVTVGGR
jgi:uncharacterized coiled-coil protein SlyX